MTHYFKMAVKGRVQRLKDSEGISDAEIAWALDEVDRICQIESPYADSTVIPINCTGGVWHRQKPEKATFRTILSIHFDTHEIIVQAILRRDDDTYGRVEMIFEAARGK